MRQRSIFGFIAAGAIALLLIGAAGFYWFFGKSPLTVIGSTSQPGAAIFVSKLAPAMVSILVNPDRLEALQKDGELSKLKTSLFANTGIDYQEDVKPWLGNEITLAVTSLDIDRDAENGQKPGYLMALATAKPDQSREFVELLFSKRTLNSEANLTVEEYKGVKVISDTSQPGKEIAGAAVGDRFVLFANDAKVLREAINNVQAPDLNLSSSDKYQQALKQLPKEAIAFTFLNLPTVAQWQKLNLKEQIYDSEIISLELFNKGLLAETSFFRTTEIPSSQLSKPVNALQYIPASAGLAISGANLSNLDKSNLAQLLTQVKSAISTDKDVISISNSKLLSPLADVQKRWGINLPEDIFSWVKGEYAIALLQSEKQITPDWIFVVENTQGVAGGISRLDAIASSKGLSISPLTLDNQKISAWTELTTVTNPEKSISLEANVRGAHTQLGNYEIFTSSIEAMNLALKAKENSLIDSRNFQDSIAAIPQPNQGYVYLDWAKSQKLVEQELPILKLVEVVGKPFFNNLRSLTVSSYGNDTGLLKGGVFFQLDAS